VAGGMDSNTLPVVKRDGQREGSIQYKVLASNQEFTMGAKFLFDGRWALQE
jgi:hypothetical protein